MFVCVRPLIPSWTMEKLTATINSPEVQIDDPKMKIQSYSSHPMPAASQVRWISKALQQYSTAEFSKTAEEDFHCLH